MREYPKDRSREGRVRQKSEKPMSKRERRRLVRLSVSGILLVLVVAVKLLMPDLANAYKDKLLILMGEDTDIVEAFSAMGKAFSREGGIRDTLEDAYTAVFGEKKPEEAASPAQTAAAFSGVYTPESLPEQTALDQRVLGFAYAPPLEGTVTSAFGYRLHPIAGHMADPRVEYKGCCFADRCEYATERCRTEAPSMHVCGEHGILCHRYAEKEEF